MKITSYQFTFERPAFDKNLLLRGSIGAAVGAGLKSAIILLSGATFAPLPLLGWSAAGAILAIATKFFKKVHKDKNERVDPALLPALGDVAVAAQKTLHQLFEKKWDSILETHTSDQLQALGKELDFKLNEGHTFLDVWNPKAFSVAVSDFAHSKGFISETPKEAWNYAFEHVDEFAEHLIDIKLQKKNLDFFEENAALFLSTYIPIRSNGTYIRGKQDKNLFESELKKYLILISDFLN
jgi:hypothetical protein